jgi:hypothetical protein
VPKNVFLSELRLFCHIEANQDLIQNARSSQSIKTVNGFANESCTILIEELAFWTRSWPHNLQVFSWKI